MICNDRQIIHFESKSPRFSNLLSTNLYNISLNNNFMIKMHLICKQIIHLESKYPRSSNLLSIIYLLLLSIYPRTYIFLNNNFTIKKINAIDLHRQIIHFESKPLDPLTYYLIYISLNNNFTIKKNQCN